MWYQICWTSKVLKFTIPLGHPGIFRKYALDVAHMFVSLSFFCAKTSSKYWISKKIISDSQSYSKASNYCTSKQTEDCPAFALCVLDIANLLKILNADVIIPRIDFVLLSSQCRWQQWSPWMFMMKPWAPWRWAGWRLRLPQATCCGTNPSTPLSLSWRKR